MKHRVRSFKSSASFCNLCNFSATTMALGQVRCLIKLFAVELSRHRSHLRYHSFLAICIFEYAVFTGSVTMFESQGKTSGVMKPNKILCMCIDTQAGQGWAGYGHSWHQHRILCQGPKSRQGILPTFPSFRVKVHYMMLQSSVIDTQAGRRWAGHGCSWHQFKIWGQA